MTGKTKVYYRQSNVFNTIGKQQTAIPSLDQNNWRVLFDYLSGCTRDTTTLLGEVHVNSITRACAFATRTFRGGATSNRDEDGEIEPSVI